MPKIIVGIGMLIGLVIAIYPKIYISFFHGWKFNESEPSDEFLNLTRIRGIIVIVFGIIYWILVS